jgi:hypothetical protein
MLEHDDAPDLEKTFSYDAYAHRILRQLSDHYERSDKQEDMFIDCVLKWSYIR